MNNENLYCSSKEDICEKYFEGTKPKHLSSFDVMTPKGNHITGYLNQKPNRFLGSMVILTVNDEPVEQFVQSMPKIHYHKDERDIASINSPCYEKLDGSCLILYPLKDYDGNMIEIIPKTRGRPVADKHFIELYEHIDQKPILDYYSENDGSLIFELFGILNQHDIIHYNVGIDVNLIGIYEYGEHITGYGENIKGFHNRKDVADAYGFKLPDQLFCIRKVDNGYFIDFTSRKYKHYLPKDSEYQPTNTDAVLSIKHHLEELNKKFVEYNNRLAVEGVVINTLRMDGSKKWLKCKPRDIEVKHRTVNGIPRRSITKEVLKYFDEYGSDVKEIYLKDENHHTEYIYRMLREEYNDDLIMKSKKKIERIFMQIWDAKEVPESIHVIAEELFNKYSDEGISYCMRLFAEEYPQKKKDAHIVYNVLEKLFVKYNKEK